MQLALVLLIAAVVVAEPPRYRQNYKFQRQEVAPDNGAAPYPAAGFRPAKEFNLPSRQEVSPPSTSYGIPDNSYGAPAETYLAPQNEYGLPEKAPEAEYGVPEKEDPKDDEEDLKVEGIKEKLQEEPKKDAEVVSAQGSYYVLLPGSQLQRVQFQTENDVRNMAYTARLEYKDEDRAPIYVYTAVPQYQPSAAYVQLF
ncbi:hypothetical protein O3G_MSEX001482 [Manduca sexta]|uniref:DUF4794 domain-containing protein n=1 Tax=Manduca sexta TaxID=7130 RepID=A0A921YL53_MANSE|nr:hypothetical protein O3G_MSEX001482 [Manduca sexta]